MKMFKKALAILLAALMAFSVMAVSASAEDAVVDAQAEEGYTLRITGAKATKTASRDRETVTELQLEVHAFDAYNREVSPSDITVNAGAKITIIDYIVPMALTLISQYSENIKEQDIQDSIQDMKLAEAKAVSYNNHVLTLAVYDKNGHEGAKMVGYEILKDFKFPGMFYAENLSAALRVKGVAPDAGENNLTELSVDGLVYRTVKLPSLMKRVVKVIVNGEGAGSLMFALLPWLPLAFFAMPLVMHYVGKSIESFYSIYDVGIAKYIAILKVVAVEILPALLSELF